MNIVQLLIQLLQRIVEALQSWLGVGSEGATLAYWDEYLVLWEGNEVMYG